MNFYLKNKYTIIFVMIFLCTLLLRILPVLNNNFPFTMDQGRDMLDIRNIAVGKHFTLIGPTTSINGVYLGPFYYYFNLLPFLLSKGDPAAILYWQIIWFQISIGALWLTIKKYSPLLALLTGGILLLAPPFFSQNKYAWTANAAPIFAAFFFSSFIWLLCKNTVPRAFLTGLIAGMVFQIEAAFGILLTPFAMLFLIYQKVNLKIIILLLLGFIVTLTPQLFFELRHNFVMTHTFLGELTGNTSVLGDKLSLSNALFSHYIDFANIAHGYLELPNFFSQYLFLLALIFLLLKFLCYKSTKNSSTIPLLSITFIIFAYFFYGFYLYPIKGWYLNSLYIPFAIILAYFLESLLESSRKWISKLSLIFIIGLLFINTLAQVKQIPLDSETRSGDRSNIRNEIEAIDWVYQKAEGKGFKIFSYIPSVYDYPYQYLFWWYGTNKYDYQPTVISYLENVPEYIQNNSTFFTKTKPLNSSYQTFLIMEKDYDMPIRQYAWLGNFTSLCKTENHIFPWETEVQILQKCQE